MPVVLGAAVDGEVLGRGDQLQVARVVALQALDERDAHAGGQVWVFAVGFLAATPARVAEDVDVGRPEGEPLVDAALALAQGLVVLGARFVGDRRGDLRHEIEVPGGRQADGLREDGGDARAADAVQALVPPVVLGHAEPLDGRRRVHHLRDLLGQRHARDEVVHALCDGQVGVEVCWHAGGDVR